MQIYKKCTGRYHNSLYDKVLGAKETSPRGFLQVRVVPNSKKNQVKKFGDGFKVYLTAPPVEGKANKMLLKILADEFNAKRSQLSITRGENSRDKIISIAR